MLASTVLIAACSSAGAESPRAGQVDIVAELDITSGNVTASKNGRVFASVHGTRRGLVEVTGRNTYVPFPNSGWNARPGSGRNVLNTPHGAVIDGLDRLRGIDHGNWMEMPQPSKLVAFDIDTHGLVLRPDLKGAAAPQGQILPDLAVDDECGFVFIAGCGLDPAIDTNRGTARRSCGHPSLAAGEC